MLVRIVAGAVAAAAVAWLARRRGALDGSGQLAALVCGTAAAAAGWAWAAVLVAYFGAAVAVTAAGAARKSARTHGTLAKGGARNAAQVAANGGVFAVLALAAGGEPATALGMAATGALAAASADTWGTEIGTLWGGTPRSILTGARIEAGMSGGVTLAGTAAAAAGSLFVAAASVLAHDTPDARHTVLVTGSAGFVGAAFDSLLGASLQERRWCARCRVHTEQRVHSCGEPTAHAGGTRWINNDVVNVAGTLAGAGAAVMISRLAA